ncbi:MAG: SufD family Fe-S cluster assembly protein [Bacteroidia bacterium]|nr:SufD family Fe-S cluster assembly protein [Bacteroidia bacterium]
MQMLTQEKLSLEAGAQHLTHLLRSQATGVGLPPSLRDHWLKWVDRADLSTLFTAQHLKEDWKYTPMEFLRHPWELGTLTASSPSFPPEGELPLIQPVESFEDLPALHSLPTPSSPWEALLGASTTYQHYQIREAGQLLLTSSNETGVLPHFVSISIAPHSQAEIWLAPHTGGFLLLRLHIHVGEGASARLYYTTDLPTRNGYLYGILSAEVEKEGQLESYDLTISAPWKRTEFKVRLTGPGASVHLHGASRIAPGEVVDQAIRIEHAAPHTESNQLFKSLVYAEGRSAFQGRIYVHREGQKTNAYQSHKALLWEPSAVAYSRPQLEIFADDVRCTHGVTTGFLQGEMLLYLRSRGIPEETARHMLAGAFLAEVVEKIPHERLRAGLYARMGFSS